MGVSGLGMVLFGITFLCSSRGLPSGLASALLLDKLSLLISFSSLGISSLNLKAPENTDRQELYSSHIMNEVCSCSVCRLFNEGRGRDTLKFSLVAEQYLTQLVKQGAAVKISRELRKMLSV